MHKISAVDYRHFHHIVSEKWMLYQRKKTMQPQISYLVCGTPRCGSSLLCEALKNTGVAGRPEEYFWRGDESFWRERWGVSTYEEYLTRAIEQGTTSNDVFSAKLMWGYFDDFVA